MDRKTFEWLDRISEALADARAVLACFGVDQPELSMRIEAALDEANALKKRIQMPSSD
jgi:hypothetical protein